MAKKVLASPGLHWHDLAYPVQKPESFQAFIRFRAKQGWDDKSNGKALLTTADLVDAYDQQVAIYQAQLAAQYEWQRDFAGQFEGMDIANASIRECIESSIHLALVLADTMRRVGSL